MSAKADGTPAAAAKQQVEEGLEALRAGLAPYVEKHMRDRRGEDWRRYASRAARDDSTDPLDVQALDDAGSGGDPDPDAPQPSPDAP